MVADIRRGVLRLRLHGGHCSDDGEHEAGIAVKVRGTWNVKGRSATYLDYIIYKCGRFGVT
jgi:hypothetical protein